MSRRLTRQKEGSVLGGVAAGFGSFFDVDPVLVRLAFILLALMEGVGIVFYIVCWIAMPLASRSDADQASVSMPAVDRAVDQARAAGERVADQARTAGHRVAEGLRGAAAAPGAWAGLASARAGAGMVLIVVGLAFLLDELGWLYWPRWARLDLLWPTLLICLGAALVARSGWRPAS